MHFPPRNAEPLSPANLAVLVALIRVHARDGRATVRTVSLEAGRNISTTHAHLRALRRRGLAGWEDDRVGTLRPLVRVASAAGV